MKNIILVLFLLSPAVAWSYDYCNIGVNPVDKNRKLADGEVLFPLPEDTLMDVWSKSGHKARCVVKKGEMVVSDHYSGEIKWIKRCGNPAREIQTKVASAISSEWSIRGVDYNPPAMQDPGMNKAYESCPEGSTCRFVQNVGYIVIGAVALRWVIRGVDHHHGGSSGSGGEGTTPVEPPPPGPVGGDAIPNLGGGPVGGNAIP